MFGRTATSGRYAGHSVTFRVIDTIRLIRIALRRSPDNVSVRSCPTPPPTVGSSVNFPSITILIRTALAHRLILSSKKIGSSAATSVSAISCQPRRGGNSLLPNREKCHPVPVFTVLKRLFDNVSVVGRMSARGYWLGARSGRLTR